MIYYDYSRGKCTPSEGYEWCLYEEKNKKHLFRKSKKSSPAVQAAESNFAVFEGWHR